MSTHYVFNALRAEDVVWKPTVHSKIPNLYLKVTCGDVQRRTRVIQDISPTWNDRFALSLPVASEHMDLTVELKHDSSWGRNPSIGSSVIILGDLVKRSIEGEVLLEFHTLHSSRAMGIAFVRLETTNERKAVEAGIKSAEILVSRSGISSSAIEPGVSAVGKMGSQSNEKSDLISALKSLVCKAQAFKELVDKLAVFHPYVNAAWQVASVLYEAIKKQVEDDEKVVGLVHEMEAIYDIINDTDSVLDKLKSLNSPVSEFLKQSIECCLFIRQYTRPGFIGRTLNVGTSQKIDEFQRRFVDLRKSLDSGVGLQTLFISARMVEKVDNLYLKQQLEPTKMDASMRPKCLPGTRTEVLTEIVDWLFSDTDQNIFWLHGVAGSGKSTISMTISEYVLSMQRRGAYLFFERGKSDANAVIRTIAYWLATFDHAIATRVTKAVENNNGIASASLDTQFMKLLREPLTAAASAMQGPVAIVLDALDECPGDVRRSLLMLIKDKFPKLPATFRFLITSRMEPDIKRALSIPSTRTLELEYSSANSYDDVARYIDHEMRTFIENAGLPISRSWKAYMVSLSRAANGLFIWASTAVKLVLTRAHDPFGALDDLLSYCRSQDPASRSPLNLGLDNLYDSVLESSQITWADVRCSRVLGLILLSKTPLSIAQIDDILCFPSTRSSRLIIERLQSVVVYSPEIPDEPVRLFHASFSDYLQAPKRCNQPWCIDVPSQRLFLAEWCFDVMEKGLRFNICDLESSFIRNEKVPDTEDRIKHRVPFHLDYACCFWAEHLCDVPYSPELTELKERLEAFAKRLLLYWFEVLSLTKHFHRACPALQRAAKWTENANLSELSLFFLDAERLARTFSSPISQSVPHIYLTAISLSRGASVVSDHYSTTVPTIAVHRYGSERVTSCMKVFGARDVNVAVTSVACSSNGKLIVSGAADGSIRVWDTVSNELVSKPFEGHTGIVVSVAFSPDSKHVVSGSFDGTIRVWNVESGEVVVGPFEGHIGCVNAIAFSPDGKRAFSGLYNGTIRIWDSESGEAVPGPFKGHTDDVLSIAFSLDGSRVVSGLYDGRIYVWDVKSGELVSGPFEGHTDAVFSVAFSPNGKRMVSGSRDWTIRVWDVESSELLSGPFEGHTGSVDSVAFLLDGNHVVSGSYDGTILMWNVESGKIVFGPLKRHASSMCSAAFSPDGKRVVSGSRNGIFRVRDTETGEVVSGPFKGHVSPVDSSAFLPDGEHVVLGYRDGSIRIWSIGNIKDSSVITVNDACHNDLLRSGCPAQSSGDESAFGHVRGITSNWITSEDGWLIGTRGELLLWIPSDTRETLWQPFNTAVLDCRPSTRLDFTGSRIGKEWHKGYKGFS